MIVAVVPRRTPAPTPTANRASVECTVPEFINRMLAGERFHNIVGDTFEYSEGSFFHWVNSSSTFINDFGYLSLGLYINTTFVPVPGEVYEFSDRADFPAEATILAELDHMDDYSNPDTFPFDADDRAWAFVRVPVAKAWAPTIGMYYEMSDTSNFSHSPIHKLVQLLPEESYPYITHDNYFRHCRLIQEDITLLIGK